MKEHLERLNEEQRRAVVHPCGPMLVLAGAGSGKTRVLTLRLAWLIQEAGVAPWETLAVTFTNKAAGEMKERVGQLLGSSAADCWVSTFHSTCLRILRREVEWVDGLEPDFVIYDDRDSKELTKLIMKELRVPDSVNPRAISAAIDRAKNDGQDPEALAAARRSDIDPRTPEIYRRYQERLRQANAVDFGDLILETVKLFEGRPEVLQRYRDRFRHVLVDEYQDTNHVQYRLICLLADHGDRNIVVVGDEDQSIYSFRGADIRNILDFERDFEGATVVRLERNYRSTETILKAAGAVVEANTERLGKTLWTDAGSGEP
ncbi:MAG: UvrD-helicase domain-containing protein, partial [Myxococcota bacterium]|nr:UvrD-helicase domain-containing protein [Myxococcota bacterium]